MKVAGQYDSNGHVVGNNEVVIWQSGNNQICKYLMNTEMAMSGDEWRWETWDFVNLRLETYTQVHVCSYLRVVCVIPPAKKKILTLFLFLSSVVLLRRQS